MRRGKPEVATLISIADNPRRAASARKSEIKIRPAERDAIIVQHLSQFGGINLYRINTIIRYSRAERDDVLDVIFPCDDQIKDWYIAKAIHKTEYMFGYRNDCFHNIWILGDNFSYVSLGRDNGHIAAKMIRDAPNKVSGLQEVAGPSAHDQGDLNPILSKAQRLAR